jgi:8-oxo-dGTP diphosphatase
VVYTSDYPIFAVTADSVLLAGDPAGGTAALQVLLIRRGRDPYAGRLALPGGFVDIDEDLGPAAARELEEETGVGGVDLVQLAAYGAPDRDPRQRTVSIAHLGLLPAPVPATAGDDAAEADWYDADAVLAGDEALAFDHAQVLRDALARVRAR